MFTPEILQLLDKASVIDNEKPRNAAAYTSFCVRIVERMQMMRVAPAPAPSTGSRWSKKPLKYGCNCSGCGTRLEAGTVGWITADITPRCLDCGNPDIVNKEATDERRS